MDETDEEEAGPTTETRRAPRDLHPALTEERLSACARLLARGPSDAVAMGDP